MYRKSASGLIGRHCIVRADFTVAGTVFDMDGVTTLMAGGCDLQLWSAVYPQAICPLLERHVSENAEDTLS